MTFEFRHLTYAVETARVGSFSRAARNLGISQPSLSLAIQQLEVELRARLFIRNSRGVVPTDIGHYVIRRAQLVLQDIEVIRSMAHGASSALNFFVTPVLAWNSAPRILERFSMTRPDVELNIREMNASQIIDALIDGVADVGLVATASAIHLSEYHRGQLEIQKLGSVNLIAALPKKFENYPDPMSLTELSDETLAIPVPSARTFGIRSGIIQAFEEAGLSSPKLRDVPSLFEAIPLAMAGLAVAVLPEDFKSTIQPGNVVLRHLVDGPKPLEISIVWRSKNASHVIDDFIATAKDVLE